jgi:membrane-associated phospholipid phosphatase
MSRLPLPGTYRRQVLVTTLACAALLALLTIAVAEGATESLDVSVRNHFRPDLVWGVDQQRSSHVVTWLSPPRMLVLLSLGATMVSAWRRTVWPLVQAAAAVALTGALTLGLKILLDRADPKGEHTSIGGSFPSGHSAILLVSVATGAMLLSCPTRWWQRVGVALAEVALDVAMLYDALHWLTDIVGGVLVAGVVLGVTALVAGPDGGPSHRRRCRPRDVDREPSRPTARRRPTSLSPRCHDGH